MFNPLLREDCFPLTCSNPNCLKQHTKEDFLNSIEKQGLIYADCGEEIFQGINCIHCKNAMLFRMPRISPLVDLRHFYIMPNAIDAYINVQEYLYETNRRSNSITPLDFEFSFPGWDPQIIDEGQIASLVPAILPDHIRTISLNSYIPYVLNETEILYRVQQEINTGMMYFRRFYPKDFNRFCLLFCILPGLLKPLTYDDEGKVEAWDASRFYSPGYNCLFQPIWTQFLEQASGNSFSDLVREKLKEKDIAPSDTEINDTIGDRLLLFYGVFPETMRELSMRIDFCEQAYKFAKKTFWKLFHDVVSHLYLSDKRRELSEWVHKVIPGKALFVDAPMGLGKSHSIVETLVKNPELSAIIFMPTRRLCEEIVESLKGKIAFKMGINRWDIAHNRENVTDTDGNIQYDEYGITEKRFNHEFLDKQVYYMDGINKCECPHFDEFIKRYENNWITKKDICEICIKEETCRFKRHISTAPLSRIVVTTHQQYKRIAQNEEMQRWYKDGYYLKNENGKLIKGNVQERDFFIIDEDIVLSQCYQPIGISNKEFKIFVSTITDFLKTHCPQTEKTQQTINNINIAWAQFDKADTTVLIPPIKSDFEIPEEIKMEWENASIPEEQWFIPEYIDLIDIVPNYLEVIEHTIRYGYVVQEYDRNENSKGLGFKQKIKKAFLPNPTFYDLEGIPPHVFFDGTMLDEKFLKKKLKNVEFEKLKINIPSIWKNRVWQNINSDLPQTKIDKEETAGKAFIDGIIKTQEQGKNIFIVSSKSIRDAYLEKLVIEKYSTHQIKISHYGNLRGINEAKECDIGIMFGSFIPSDAIEIAMCLELFTESMKPKNILKTYGNLWTWQESKSVRVYKDEYQLIEEMSKALQLTEHRQAIARTRYLFHNVDFYILSKRLINTYEPYFSEVETQQYREDLFPPRKPRDDKKDPVKEAVIDWLSKNKTVNSTDIFNNYGIRRQTVAKYLKQMAGDGLLVNESKTKYKLSDSEDKKENEEYEDESENGHFIL